MRLRTITKASIAGMLAATITAGSVGTAAADTYRYKRVETYHHADGPPPWANGPPRWANKYKHKNKHWKESHYRRDREWEYREYRHHHHYHNRRAGIDTDGINGGTIIGGILGAVVGNQFGKGRGKVLATVGGAVIGGIVGHNIHRDMQQRDRIQMNSALETMPTGQTAQWSNPDTGGSYSVTPTRTYRDTASRDCRDYTTWVFINGYEKQVTGTACRQPDGSWQIIS